MRNHPALSAKTTIAFTSIQTPRGTEVSPLRLWHFVLGLGLRVFGRWSSLGSSKMQKEQEPLPNAKGEHKWNMFGMSLPFADY